MDTAQLNRDLSDEQAALDEVVAGLDDAAWALPTPSDRWSVADQIAHLTFFDRAAVVAIRDPDAFGALFEALLGSAADGDEGVDAHTLGEFRAMSPAELLEAWREGRRRLSAAADTLQEGARVNWFGPPMSGRSFLTARLMEVWAHGQDICDAVGAARPPTDRLAHIARLGFLTRSWTFINRGEDAPTSEVRVELRAPDGTATSSAGWEFGPADATERVSGSAEDFCLVVTQRRHLDDTALRIVGDDALSWMTQAQAFAGPPTDPPVPAGIKLD